MKVSEIVKNITEIQDSNYVKFMGEDELKLFNKYKWLVWNSIKRIKDEVVILKLAENQKALESLIDKPEQWYSVLIHTIPKKKYSYIYPKKKKKKNYDYEFINLLAKDFQISTRECEDYYEILEHHGMLEDEKFKLNSKYGIVYEPQPDKLDEIQLVDISKIREHPLNKEIYSSGRKGEDEELEENIKLYGLLQPIIVDNKTNFIISGNRRFQACINIGLKKVKVIKSSFDYDVIALINFNKYRTKTTIEKVNEYRMMKTQIKKMGYKDRKKIMGGVGMRDYIFQQTGVSQKTEHQLSFVEDKNPKLAEMVLTGEISIKKAYQEVNKKPKTHTQEVKDKLEELKKLITYDIFPYMGKSKLLQIIDWIYDDKPSISQTTSVHPTSDKYKSMWINLMEHYGLNDDGKYSGNDLDFYSSFVFNLQRENPKHEQLMGDLFWKIYEDKAKENGWRLDKKTDNEVWKREFGRGKEFSNGKESKFKNWMPSKEELKEKENLGKNEHGNSEFSTRMLEKDTWKKRFGDKSMEDIIEE